MHQRIIDVDVLAVVEFEVLGEISPYDLPVPLLQHLYEKSEVLVAAVERVMCQLFQLELRVLLASEQ